MLREPVPLDVVHLPRKPASVTEAECIAEPHHNRRKPHDEEHIKAPQGVKRKKPPSRLRRAILVLLEQQQPLRHLLHGVLITPRPSPPNLLTVVSNTPLWFAYGRSSKSGTWHNATINGALWMSGRSCASFLHLYYDGYSSISHLHDHNELSVKHLHSGLGEYL